MLGVAIPIDLSGVIDYAPAIVTGIVAFTALAATVVVARGGSRLALGWLRGIFRFGR